MDDSKSKRQSARLAAINVGASTSGSSRKRRLSDAGDDEPVLKVQNSQLVSKQPVQDADLDRPGLLALSDEILMEIFKHCTSNSLYELSRSCQKFANLVWDRRLWMLTDFTDMPLSNTDVRQRLQYLNENTASVKYKGQVGLYPDSKYNNETLTENFLHKLDMKCPNLKKLEITEAFINFDKIKSILFPKGLESLCFYRCQGTIPHQTKMFFIKCDSYFENLQELVLEECHWFNTHDLIVFSKLPKLKRLSLKGCISMKESVPYGSIATRFGFKNLEIFDLRGTPVTDSDIQCFNQVRSLKELYLECPESCRVPLPYHEGDLLDPPRDQAGPGGEEADREAGRGHVRVHLSLTNRRRQELRNMQARLMARINNQHRMMQIEQMVQAYPRNLRRPNRPEINALGYPPVQNLLERQAMLQQRMINIIQLRYMGNRGVIRMEQDLNQQNEDPENIPRQIRNLENLANNAPEDAPDPNELEVEEVFLLNINEHNPQLERVAMPPELGVPQPAPAVADPVQAVPQAAAVQQLEQAGAEPAAPQPEQQLPEQIPPQPMRLLLRTNRFRQPELVNLGAANPAQLNGQAQREFNNHLPNPQQQVHEQPDVIPVQAEPEPNRILGDGQIPPLEQPRVQAIHVINRQQQPEPAANDAANAAQPNGQAQRGVDYRPQQVIIIRGVNNDDGYDPYVQLDRIFNAINDNLRAHNYPQNNYENSMYSVISDRGICAFGQAANNAQDDVVWIRAPHAPDSRDTPLEKLVLRHYTHVTDVTLRHLEQCSPKLVHLDVTGTSITEAGIRAFKVIKPNCTVISNFDI